MRSMWKYSIFGVMIIFSITPILGQVAIQIGDVTPAAYTEDIAVPVILSNPSDEIAGIQFDINIDPALVALSGVDTTGVPAGFVTDYNMLGEGYARILLFNEAGTGVIPVNSDTIMYLHFDGSTITSAVLELIISELLVSDSSANLLSSTGINGSIQIGYVVSLAITSDSADVGEFAQLTINMDNGGLVGGLQFDLFDTPDYLTVDSVWTTDRTDGFTIDTAQVEAGTRILLYNSANENISAGSGPVLNVRFIVHYNAYAENVVIKLDGVTATDDIGGIYWIAALDSGIVTIYPGYMEEPHNLVAISELDGQVPLGWEAPYGPIPPEAEFTVAIYTDDYPEETSWELLNEDGDLVSGISTGDLTSPVTLYEWDMTIESGTYVFTIFDSFGDGICCGYGEGYYSLFLNGVEIASGGEFGESESVTFNTTDGMVTRAQRFFEEPFPFEKGSIISADAISSLTISAPVIDYYTISVPVREQNNSIRNNVRELNISNYNIYRAVGSVSDFSLLDVVDSDVISYVDQAVTNGTTYNYYVTTVYESGGESDSSNQAAATPVEWVELSISDGTALSGQVDTLEIFLNNESDVTGVQFTLRYDPDVIQTQGVIPTGRTDNFQVINQLDNQVLFFNGVITPGSDAIALIVVRPVSDEAVTVTVDMVEASIKDVNDNDMQWTLTPGTFDVTIETQMLMLSNALGNPGGTVTMSLLINNTQNVHGIQIFLVDAPDYLTGIAVSATNHIDFSNWTVDGNSVGNEYRILLYDNSLSNPIPPGSGHIIDIAFLVASTAPVGTTIDVEMTDVVISDVNNIPMHTVPYNGHVYIGTPDAFFTISEVNGSNPGGTGSYTISLQNLAPVYVFELSIMDIPANLTITNIIRESRFANGTIDGNSGEMGDGMGYILGYDLASGIQPGGGPILTVEVQADANTDVGDILLMIMEVSAADANLSAMPAMTGGFGIYSVSLSVVENDFVPQEFALHPNYPNPFNPVTTIGYDLKEDAVTSLIIYDLRGCEIKTLVNQKQTAGRKTIIWNATDNQNRPVGGGMYIYRLLAGDFTDTHKMVLLK